VKIIADTHAQKADLTGVIDVSESFVHEVFNASCMPIPVYSIDVMAGEGCKDETYSSADMVS
jgi:hypothetical protein